MTEATAIVTVSGKAGPDVPVSTPWTAPAFAPPPHSWTGVASIIVSYTPDPQEAAALLPPGFELADGAASVVMLSYPATDFMHPFNECVVLLPVRVGDVTGNYVPYIYVTTDEALIPGREIAGWPKRIADVRWERDGDHISASVTRFGETILEVEGDVTGPVPPEMVQAQADTANPPSLNYKLVPGPDGTSIEVEEITSTQLEIDVHAVELATAKLRTFTTADNPMGALVGEAEGPMLVLVSDNTIPAGHVVARIERGAGS